MSKNPAGDMSSDSLQLLKQSWIMNCLARNTNHWILMSPRGFVQSWPLSSGVAHPTWPMPSRKGSRPDKRTTSKCCVFALSFSFRADPDVFLCSSKVHKGKVSGCHLKKNLDTNSITRLLKHEQSQSTQGGCSRISRSWTMHHTWFCASFNAASFEHVG